MGFQASLGSKHGPALVSRDIDIEATPPRRQNGFFLLKQLSLCAVELSKERWKQPRTKELGIHVSRGLGSRNFARNSENRREKDALL